MVRASAVRVAKVLREGRGREGREASTGGRDSRRSGDRRPDNRREGGPRREPRWPWPQAGGSALRNGQTRRRQTGCSSPKSPKPPEVAATHLDEMGGDLLASVSRSFALTIRLLPDPLREPISLGYLLARAYGYHRGYHTRRADGAARTSPRRARNDQIRTGPLNLIQPLQRDLVSRQTHEGERALLKQLDRALAWLEAQLPEDRWELRRTLARIGRAQELDVLRFAEGTADEPTPLGTDGGIRRVHLFDRRMRRRTLDPPLRAASPGRLA